MGSSKKRLKSLIGLKKRKRTNLFKGHQEPKEGGTKVEETGEVPPRSWFDVRFKEAAHA
ncbi:hypothetical protein HPP92_000556 [Vanilla planifolia]|uniref:Uncharacterized protein n=1 Tax=Vanilla planifolia TaxID=51239 RepID=A0A835VG75_VANPL|nr:hypothetical protein HPP92_000556 [Vanilla planifolia]